jgi:hypothetical protein
MMVCKIDDLLLWQYEQVDVVKTLKDTKFGREFEFEFNAWQRQQHHLHWYPSP